MSNHRYPRLIGALAALAVLLSAAVPAAAQSLNKIRLLMPVTQIDDQVIGNGKPGLTTLKLRERYLRYMAEAGVA